MMTTICAFCQTEFRVTRQQISARAGQVRCGKCHNVFNALAALSRRGEDDRDASAEIAAGEQIATAAISVSNPATPGDSEISWPPIKFSDYPPAGAADPLADPAINASPAATLPPARAKEGKDLESFPAAMPGGAVPAYDFGPKPRAKRGRWWLPLAAVLLLGLLGQTLFYFRGAIALVLPESKPYINELCAELACEVPLPRRAELVSIETSDLQADPTNPGVMVLLATLRNRAAFPQAFPAVELTLTNERDQPLARRVLQPDDYLADKAEAFDGSSEKQIRLYVEAGALKASGYRLYLFYP